VLPGLLIGLAVHAVPGLTTSMALAICLPLIPYMDFLQALIFMTAMYAGALFGVAIPAVLLNVPGSAAAVGTTFDGFPMAQAGRHNEALGLALAASCVGQAIAYLLLLCLAQPIAAFAIRLGPPEMLMVALWGMTLIARLRGRHLARGLLAGVFGLLLGTVGLSVRGAARGPSASICCWMASQRCRRLSVSLRRRNRSTSSVVSASWTTERAARSMQAASLRACGRHSAIPPPCCAARSWAAALAFCPAGTRSLICCHIQKRGARLLALGIPTGGATAVMLVAFGMHNITGGPAFMRDHADIVYAVILSSLAQVAILAVVGFGFIFVAGFVVKVRLRLLVPIVLSLAVVGSYALAQNMAGPITLAVFAVIGWLMQRFDYPVAAAVVGLLLGRLTEGALLRTYQMSGGDIGFLLTRPIALAILFLLIGSIALPYLRLGRIRFAEKRQGRIV
jgi:putative tricarboxylic transport membrane protein